MAERRGLKSGENQSRLNSRPLLDLGGGNRRGLERAFQALVGHPAAPPSSPAPAADPFDEAVRQALVKLGFELREPEAGRSEILLSHHLAARQVPLALPAPRPADPEGWALNFAARRFPEMEFYLPYISLRAAYLKRQASSGGPRPRTPEPEYDEDGFLVEQL